MLHADSYCSNQEVAHWQDACECAHTVWSKIIHTYVSSLKCFFLFCSGFFSPNSTNAVTPVPITTISYCDKSGWHRVNDKTKNNSWCFSCDWCNVNSLIDGLWLLIHEDLLHYCNKYKHKLQKYIIFPPGFAISITVSLLTAVYVLCQKQKLRFSTPN